MNGYEFTADCIHCGGELQHCNGVNRAGTESVAIARCSQCGTNWYLELHLRPFRDSPEAQRQRKHRQRVHA